MQGEIAYALGLSGIFLAVLLLGLAIYALVMAPLQRHWQLQGRLGGRQSASRERVFKLGQEAEQSPTLFLVKRVAGWSRIESLRSCMLQADISWKLGTFLSLASLLVAVGFLVGQLCGSFGASICLATVLGLFPFVFLRWKSRRKARLFEKQLPGALELFSRSLRAGHTLATAIELVSREIPPPLGFEMRTAYEEQRLGLSMAAALQNMDKRVESPDLRFFITAVLIQFDTGGNLAEMMDKLARMIRIRLNFKEKIKSLTAEGRFSALILGILPVVIFIALYFLNPEYILTLVRDPLGRKLLWAVIIGILLGAFTMRRMIQIKV